MLSLREHLVGAVVLVALLDIARRLLVGWFELWWVVAVGLAVLFVPLFFVAHVVGVGIVWLLRRLFEGRGETEPGTE